MKAKDTVMDKEQVKVNAHEMDSKIDENGYIIEDEDTHSDGWIDEMLEYGMSVFLSVTQAQAEITWGKAIKEVVDWVESQGTHENVVIYPIEIYGADWQAKLKEWGINEEG